jgi:hypothetical protein
MFSHDSKRVLRHALKNAVIAEKGQILGMDGKYPHGIYHRGPQVNLIIG